MIRSEVELQTIGAEISGIKDHEFKTMAEYANAYVQVAPLLDDYDDKLEVYADLCKRAQRRDERRSLINILRNQNSYSSDVWRDASEIIQLVRAISAVRVSHDVSLNTRTMPVELDVHTSDLPGIPG